MSRAPAVLKADPRLADRVLAGKVTLAAAYDKVRTPATTRTAGALAGCSAGLGRSLEFGLGRSLEPGLVGCSTVSPVAIAA